MPKLLPREVNSTDTPKISESNLVDQIEKKALSLSGNKVATNEEVKAKNSEDESLIPVFSKNNNKNASAKHPNTTIAYSKMLLYLGIIILLILAMRIHLKEYP